MTYREKIQQMIEQINQLYDDAGRLRDLATGEEKQYWNKFRNGFFTAHNPLQELDNSISDKRGATKID